MLSGISIFPGIDHLPNIHNIRTLGAPGSEETFGAGIIKKEKGYDFKNKRQDNYALVYIIRGRGFLELDNQKYPLEAGMFFQRFPYQIHSNYTDNEWQEAYLALGAQMFNALKSMEMIKTKTPVFKGPENQNDRLKIIRLFYSLTDSMNQLKPDNTLSFLAEELSAINQLMTSSADEDVIDRFCSESGQHPEKRQALEEFCREKNCGYEWFRKEFKRRKGISPAAYGVNQRINNAWYL